MKKIVKLPSLSRVVAGSLATLEMPIGPTYERVVFVVESVAGGLNAPDIGRISLLINGSVKQTFVNLQRLVDINAYWGRDTDTITTNRMEFAVHLNRAELLDSVWRSAPGLGTADLSTLHFEIQVDGAAPADITIKAQAQVNPVRQNLGVFFNIKELPFNSSVLGQVDVDKLQRGPWYSAIHLFKSDITDVEVVANDVKILDATKQVLERFQKGSSPMRRVPQTAKATHIDFITDGNLLDSLQTANLSDFRIKMTLGSAGAVDIVTETLDTLAN